MNTNNQKKRFTVITNFAGEYRGLVEEIGYEFVRESDRLNGYLYSKDDLSMAIEEEIDSVKFNYVWSKGYN